MRKKIYIHSFASISSLGSSEEDVWNAYLDPKAFFQKQEFSGKEEWVSQLQKKECELIENLREENKKYKELDPSVLYAIFASRQLLKDKTPQNLAVNIGSSRGATTLFEAYHKEFLASTVASTLSSPTTTLGNLSSWVAQDLGSDGLSMSHSITCSTALHSILNAVAWLTSGMAADFLVGGTEAPLTPFTVAQMKALKLYSSSKSNLPCRSLDFSKKSNTLILGEAAAVFLLSTKKEKALFSLLGVGFATEIITHNTSISSEAICFQKSMQMALDNAGLTSVDAIVMHAAGTQKGDEAELKAIQHCFEEVPLITTNKWKIGHSFGASGAMSLEMALLMLKHNKFIPNPFFQQENTDKNLQHIMVNAVGFGGNAVSLIVGKL